jgi:DNA-binding NarL/FixJ family response regulator
VGEATHGQDLLAQIEAGCPDLVLLSWRLSGLTGDDLLPALWSVCDDVYVIVLSGRPEARQAIMDAGANAFISKTESPEQLLAAIASAENAIEAVDHRDARGTSVPVEDVEAAVASAGHTDQKGGKTRDTKSRRLYRSKITRHLAIRKGERK